jgi:hypothetical protein
VSPEYTTETTLLPTGSVEAVKVACPEASRDTIATVLDPTVKVTVPVGVPPLPLTVAVKLTV